VRRYYFSQVLLGQSWARDVLVTVSGQGIISDIARGPRPDGGTIDRSQGGRGGMDDATGNRGGEEGRVADPGNRGAELERVDGIVVPGMANAHSHAFQRAMAGDTEYRASARDSFWTWRRAMYALANRIEPEDLQILATQLFVEMLKRGYTTVAEFHYLHRRTDGQPYAGANALWQAIGAAAASAGIGLTFLPTLYQTSDFGGQPLKPEQARFASDTDQFLREVEAHMKSAAGQRVGVAFHSLRAVPLEELRRAAQRLHELDPTMPLHIHVAEQLLEVQACVRATGRRPIELLLESGVLSRHWCLVHATHATAREITGIAASAAAVCVSITTEANLGDGFFDTARFVGAQGRLCVGSDSQCTVSPAEELRWLEYQQRLRKRRRAVLASSAEPHVGTRLWRDAALHGAEAIGQPAGVIEVGRRADWLVLDAGHPALLGAAPDTALDHLLFAGGEAAIRDVMVAGRWVIKDGRHAGDPELAPRFAALMRRLAAA